MRRVQANTQRSRTLIVDTNLEQYPTPTYVDASVTPNPPQAFVPVTASDGLHTYIVGVAGKLASTRAAYGT